MIQTIISIIFRELKITVFATIEGVKNLKIYNFSSFILVCIHHTDKLISRFNISIRIRFKFNRIFNIPIHWAQVFHFCHKHACYILI